MTTAPSASDAVGAESSRRRRRLVVRVLVAALLVAGVVALVVVPDSPSPGSPTDEDATVLEGEVVNLASGEALVNARVRVDHEAGPTEVRTDAPGRHQLEVDASRPVALTADAPGHQGVVAFGKLCPGQRTELRLALPPADPDQAPPAPIVIPGACE